MSEIPTIDEIIAVLLAREWRPKEIYVKVFIQSVSAFRKKNGYITQKQEDSLRRTWDVHLRREAEIARGVEVATIPDDYFAKTAERRRGFPRNMHPYFRSPKGEPGSDPRDPRLVQSNQHHEPIARKPRSRPTSSG